MSRRFTFVPVSVVVLLALGVVAGCTAESAAGPDGTDAPETETSNHGVVSERLVTSSLEVSFQDCSELASITTISVAEARKVVPSSFALAGDASGAPFVVRVADCSAVSIDGHRPESGTVAQLGVSVVSPDGTGDINNYTAWYYTTSVRLASRLRVLGIPAQYVPRLAYDFVPNAAQSGGALTIAVPPPGHPAFRVSATVVEPGPGAIPFVANWWKQSGSRRIKMSTPIPSIHFGGATSTLQTARFGALGRLLESSTETFAVFDSFNRFASAPMTVTATRP